MNNRENIRSVNFEAIIILLIILTGLLVNRNYFNNSTETRKKPVASYTSVSENCAVSNSILRLQVFQKSWISNKDNFNFFAFNRNPVDSNKKTGLKLNQNQLIRQSLLRVPQFILRYHLFPPEKDDPQILG